MIWGADDYISKPFRPRELVSRIGVVLRRSGKASAVLESGGITIDTGKAVVKREGNEIFFIGVRIPYFTYFISKQRDGSFQREVVRGNLGRGR